MKDEVREVVEDREEEQWEMREIRKTFWRS
jgi:hypothetical protein